LAFSYWFDSTVVSQLREDLLLCLSYLPLGVPNELFLQAISVRREIRQIWRGLSREKEKGAREESEGVLQRVVAWGGG
jgi:hypothetical protein